MSSINDRVKRILAEQFVLDDPNSISDTAAFVDDLGADSLDAVELLAEFEEAFECDIPDDDADKLITVQDAIDYLTRRATPFPKGNES